MINKKLEIYSQRKIKKKLFNQNNKLHAWIYKEIICIN